GDRTDRCDAADIVAAEVEQHEVLGPLLGIADELLLQSRVRLGRCATRAGARERAERDAAVANTHENFRRGADQREGTEVQMKEKRRWIGTTKRPVKREGWQCERCREAL